MGAKVGEAYRASDMMGVPLGCAPTWVPLGLRCSVGKRYKGQWFISGAQSSCYLPTHMEVFYNFNN